MTVSSFINNRVCSMFDDVIELIRKTFKLMYCDESGILEPQSDILSTALAVIGFTVLAALMSQAYLGYEDRSFSLENYESASLLADSIARAPALRAGSSNLLSAESLDKLSGPGGLKDREKLFAAFSGNYQFYIEIKTQDELWNWRVEPVNVGSDFFSEGREKIAVSVPVVIELNPAKSVPGTLKVVLLKADWK